MDEICPKYRKSLVIVVLVDTSLQHCVAVGDSASRLADRGGDIYIYTHTHHLAVVTWEVNAWKSAEKNFFSFASAFSMQVVGDVTAFTPWTSRQLIGY